MAATFSKIAVSDIATLVNRAVLPPEAREVLRGCTGVGEVLDRLQAGGFASEAVRVLAHALPKREGVWWACACAASTAPRETSDPDRLARETAEQWVALQNDGLRHAAMSYADAAGLATAEAWIGIATFWSGASIARLGQPPQQPLPEQANGAVAAAVTLAAVRGDPRRHAVRLQRFLDSGREIASGGAGRIPPETG